MKGRGRLTVSRRGAFVTASLALLLAGCGRPSGPYVPVSAAPLPAKSMPSLDAGRLMEPGVRLHEVTLNRNGTPMRLWVYLPERRRQAKLPCVFIAPAGSRMFHGMRLEEGDRPEHLPYARAGFAVVAYDVDGPLGDSPSEAEIAEAARAFKAADAGLNNTRAAIDYALAKLPVDPKRLYAIGHSSAASLALLVAEHEPRIQACVAYAPACYLDQRVGRIIGPLSGPVPGFAEFIRWSSPMTAADRLLCPLFLFHADDDSVVSKEEVQDFAAKVMRTNPRVTLVHVPTGSHYDSMVEAGIPRAVPWLKAQKPK